MTLKGIVALKIRCTQHDSIFIYCIKALLPIFVKDVFSQSGGSGKVFESLEGIALVYLFGSVARGFETKMSDIELAVLIRDPLG